MPLSKTMPSKQVEMIQTVHNDEEHLSDVKQKEHQ